MSAFRHPSVVPCPRPPRLAAGLALAAWLAVLPSLQGAPAPAALSAGSATTVPVQDRTVSVLYAGSLAAVMENGLGPAFTRASGFAYQGEAQGSLGAAQLIHDGVRTPDVFISADPLVNDKVLMGPANRNLVRWYAILASSQLVIGYNPRSSFFPRFEAAKANRVPWYEVLEAPGVRFGRGDPTIDPKGYRTLFMFRLAGRHYHRPELPALPGDPLNPAQVFPEIVLLARLESGQFDAGIFYRHEAVAHKLPFISLPPEINLGDVRFSGLYAQESYTSPAGQRVTGAPILFTVTIPETVRHRQAALAFARFLLSSDELLEQFGFGRVQHQVGGDMTRVPPGLRDLCKGRFAP
ncbi:MAG TPA: extracellular solute-binding protein [Thermoanaerobaculia bacterium]|nr:extracellular solute-binding protein [Thermoanaerobaculia bacterium]